MSVTQDVITQMNTWLQQLDTLAQSQEEASHLAGESAQLLAERDDLETTAQNSPLYGQSLESIEELLNNVGQAEREVAARGGLEAVQVAIEQGQSQLEQLRVEADTLRALAGQVNTLLDIKAKLSLIGQIAALLDELQSPDNMSLLTTYDELTARRNQFEAIDRENQEGSIHVNQLVEDLIQSYQNLGISLDERKLRSAIEAPKPVLPPWIGRLEEQARQQAESLQAKVSSLHEENAGRHEQMLEARAKRDAYQQQFEVRGRFATDADLQTWVDNIWEACKYPATADDFDDPESLLRFLESQKQLREALLDFVKAELVIRSQRGYDVLSDENTS